MLGLMLCLVLVLIPSCREDKPPTLSMICTLDGYGGGDCSTSSHVHKYLSPSEMKDYFAISQDDAKNLMTWCYNP